MSAGVRVALAQLRPGGDRDDALARVLEAVAEAGRAGAVVVCTPELYVPGYPWPPPSRPAAVDVPFLDGAWAAVRAAAAAAGVGVVLGTERLADGEPRITCRVADRDGTDLGVQDKVQLDPTEDLAYRPGEGRRVFEVGGLRFGVVICHEGWRYPETVRACAAGDARVVFHPHHHPAEPGGHVPGMFADPAGPFHESAMRCRAAENTVFFASVNIADEGSPTTSAVVGPDGQVRAVKPRGEQGLLVVDIDPGEATGLLARRLRG